jgi:acetyl esterase/lipase
MIYRVIPGAEFCADLPPSETQVTLTVYARARLGFPADDGHRWGLLILPGGGYQVHSLPEAEPVALTFLQAGVQCFVLNYSLVPDRYPQQLLEAGAAVRYLRAHGAEYGIDRVAVCGFSAGGHLAGLLANLWHLPLLSETLGVPAEVLRPDGAILSYPVVTYSPENQSFSNLLGRKATEEEISLLSLERSVTAQNPPTFLWATVTDEMVPVQNAMNYAQALLHAGVSLEFHLFPKGPHVTSVGTAESAYRKGCINPHAAHWTELCAEWLKSLPPKDEPTNHRKGAMIP